MNSCTLLVSYDRWSGDGGSVYNNIIMSYWKDTTREYDKRVYAWKCMLYVVSDHKNASDSDLLYRLSMV